MVIHNLNEVEKGIVKAYFERLKTDLDEKAKNKNMLNPKFTYAEIVEAIDNLLK